VSSGTGLSDRHSEPTTGYAPSGVSSRTRSLARDLIERLYDGGVSTVYVGDSTDVLETQWSERTNATTHNFWAFRGSIDRLACTAEEFGITVDSQPEAWTSQQCPNCGSTEDTTRHRDTLTCPCGFEGHADLTASETFLRRHETDIPRPMARPVRFEWDDHGWSAISHAHESPKEVRPNRSIHAEENVARVGGRL